MTEEDLGKIKRGDTVVVTTRYREPGKSPTERIGEVARVTATLIILADGDKFNRTTGGIVPKPPLWYPKVAITERSEDV